MFGAPPFYASVTRLLGAPDVGMSPEVRRGVLGSAAVARRARARARGVVLTCAPSAVQAAHRFLERLRAEWGVSEAQHAALCGAAGGAGAGAAGPDAAFSAVQAAPPAPVSEGGSARKKAVSRAQSQLAATRELALPVVADTVAPLLCTRDVCAARAVCRAWRVAFSAPAWYTHIHVAHFYPVPAMHTRWLLRVPDPARLPRARGVPFTDSDLAVLLVRGAGRVRSVTLHQTLVSDLGRALLGMQARLVHLRVSNETLDGTACATCAPAHAVAWALTGRADAAGVLARLRAEPGCADTVRRCALALDTLRQMTPSARGADGGLGRACAAARAPLLQALQAHGHAALTPEAAQCALRLLRRQLPRELGSAAAASYVRAAAATLRAHSAARPGDAPTDGALREAVLVLAVIARQCSGSGGGGAPQGDADATAALHADMLAAAAAVAALLRRNSSGLRDDVAAAALATMALIHVFFGGAPEQTTAAAFARAGGALRDALGGGDVRLSAAVRVALLRLAFPDGASMETAWFDCEAEAESQFQPDSDSDDLDSDSEAESEEEEEAPEALGGGELVPEALDARNAATAMLALVALLHVPRLSGDAAAAALAILSAVGVSAVFPTAPPAGVAAAVVAALCAHRSSVHPQRALEALYACLDAAFPSEGGAWPPEHAEAQLRAAVDAGALAAVVEAMAAGGPSLPPFSKALLCILADADAGDAAARDALIAACVRRMPYCLTPCSPWVGTLAHLLGVLDPDTYICSPPSADGDAAVRAAAAHGVAAAAVAALNSRVYRSIRYATAVLRRMWDAGGAPREAVQAAGAPAALRRARQTQFIVAVAAAPTDEQERGVFVRAIGAAADAMAPPPQPQP